MKHALIAAVLLSLGGVAAGCGGDSSSPSADARPSSSNTSAADAPTDAKSTDLCAALTKGAQIKDGADVAAFARGLQEAGTPAEIPDTARKGFEAYVGVLQDVDPEASAQELGQMKDPGLSATEKSDVQSFLGYAQQTCAPSTPSAPTSSAG